MPEESSTDPFWIQLCEGYNESIIAEINQYLTEWDKSTYISVAHNIVDHALRKQIDPFAKEMNI